MMIFIKYLRLAAVLVPFVLFQACADGCNCSPLRNYQVNTDKKISDLKEKISTMEKEDAHQKYAYQLAGWYNQLGTIYLQKELWDQAIESFHKSIKLGSNTASINYSLGLAYANRGNDINDDKDFKTAENFYRKALKIQSRYSDAKYALSVLYFYKLDKKDDSIILLEELISEDRKHYKARFALGRFFYELDKLDKSLNVYEDLYKDLEKLPDNQITIQYKEHCKGNINRIMMELSQK